MSTVSFQDFAQGQPVNVVDNEGDVQTKESTSGPSFFQSLAQTAKQAGSKLSEIGSRVKSGETGLSSATIQGAGALAGGVLGATGDAINAIPGATEAIGAVAKPISAGIKATQDWLENNPTFKNAVTGEKADKIASILDAHPDIARNAEAIDNIANAVLLGKGGLEAAGKTTALAGDALNAAGNAGKTVLNSASKLTGEIVPTTDRMISHQVTQALDLTQGDVRNIAKSTNNEVGKFLADNNLIAGNKEETIKMVNDFYTKNYSKVREEIGKVDTKFTPEEVPRFTQSLKEIQKQVNEVPGLEEAGKEVKDLLAKKEVTLADVQKAKELMDDHFNLYKVTGDVKEGIAKEGLSKIRTDLKEFIEKQVKDTTGEDIARLNNNVSTSRSIADAVETRSTRGLTTSNIKLGDLGIFGVGTAVAGPLGGAAAVLGKKILESSATRLKVARFLDGISDERKAAIKATLEKGEVPEELNKVVSPQSNSSTEGKVLKVSSSVDSTPKEIKGKGIRGSVDPSLIIRDLKGKFNGVAEKFSHYDYKTMTKFLDYAKGMSKISKEEAIELERKAGVFLEDQGKKVPKTKEALRAAVAKIIAEADNE